MSVKRKKECYVSSESYLSSQSYLSSESYSYLQEKPEDCIICTEKMEDDRSLECGHWIHYSCIQKQFKAECPVCRKSLKIEVKGKRPSSEFVAPDQPLAQWDVVQRGVDQPGLEQEGLEQPGVAEGGLQRYSNIGYVLYDEESEEESDVNEEDYDEENPSGDSVYYD